MRLLKTLHQPGPSGREDQERSSGPHSSYTPGPVSSAWLQDGDLGKVPPELPSPTDTDRQTETSLLLGKVMRDVREARLLKEIPSPSVHTEGVVRTRDTEEYLNPKMDHGREKK